MKPLWKRDPLVVCQIFQAQSLVSLEFCLQRIGSSTPTLYGTAESTVESARQSVFSGQGTAPGCSGDYRCSLHYCYREPLDEGRCNHCRRDLYCSLLHHLHGL